MLNLGNRPCSRCGGTAKGAVILFKTSKVQLDRSKDAVDMRRGEGVPLCEQCLTKVELVINSTTEDLVTFVWR